MIPFVETCEGGKCKALFFPLQVAETGIFSGQEEKERGHLASFIIRGTRARTPEIAYRRNWIPSSSSSSSSSWVVFVKDLRDTSCLARVASPYTSGYPSSWDQDFLYNLSALARSKSKRELLFDLHQRNYGSHRDSIEKQLLLLIPYPRPNVANPRRPWRKSLATKEQRREETRRNETGSRRDNRFQA